MTGQNRLTSPPAPEDLASQLDDWLRSSDAAVESHDEVLATPEASQPDVGADGSRVGVEDDDVPASELGELAGQMASSPTGVDAQVPVAVFPGELEQAELEPRHFTEAVETADGIEIWDDFEALMDARDRRAARASAGRGAAGGGRAARIAKRQRRLAFWGGSLVGALIVAFAFSTFIAEPYRVSSDSMVPTIEKGDVVAVYRLSYHLHEPRRGDVAVHKHPEGGSDLVKRVIGLPGETIESRDGIVFIDDRELVEPYVDEAHVGEGPAIERQTLGEDMYFVLGDARGASYDSRSFGPIPGDAFVGRAAFTLWRPDLSGL